MNAASVVPWVFAPSAAATAVWLLGVRNGRARIAAVGHGAPPVQARWHGLRVRCAVVRRRPGFAALLAVPVAGVALAAVLGSAVPLLVAGPVAVFVARRGIRLARQRVAEEVRRAMAEFATTMVGELRSGHPPVEAFVTAAETLDGPGADCLSRPIAVARVGGDVPESLAAAAAVPGAASLARVAACWVIAAERGAGFAAALDRVAAGLRDEEAAARELEAELAGARSTARLLAGLPVVGVLLGTGVGAAPLDVLVGTPPGVVCLLAGLGLVGAGLTWTDRIADRARGAACPG